MYAKASAYLPSPLCQSFLHCHGIIAQNYIAGFRFFADRGPKNGVYDTALLEKYGFDTALLENRGHDTALLTKYGF